MSRRGNKRKRVRQRKPHEEWKQLKQRQAAKLLPSRLIAKLADPITSRGILGKVIEKHQQP